MNTRSSGNQRHRDWIAHARQQVGASGSDLPDWAMLRQAASPLDTLPGYEIGDEIHRGGQGVVYQAVHQSTGRRVAIKVMREGPFASAAERARFEREVRVLGALQHPGIVTIHDSGVAAGSHFFTMDYVEGQPLDQHVGGLKDIRAIVAIFVRICDAVHAAHLLGVVHRDLKPGNIRIAPDGAPHVLDFGLAKAVGAGGVPTEEATVTGQFLGSLPWASPEQACGRLDEITPRSDVYSLGVMLFHALTGRFPYVTAGDVTRVLHDIQHAEPVRPRALRRQIDDDLQIIILKCLSKEPQRRYATAGGLSQDLSRYLASEPISARRDSAWYMFRKTVKRYRWPLGIAAAFMLVLAGSSAWLWMMYRHQSGLRREAEAQRLAADEAREMEASQRAAAQREARKSIEVMRFVLMDLFDSADPAKHGRPDLTVREVMESAEQSLQHGALKSEPDVLAAVHLASGNVYRALGLYDKSQSHLSGALDITRRLFGDDHPDVADCKQHLGLLHEARGDLTSAEQYLREAYSIKSSGSPPSEAEVELLAELGAVRRKRGDLIEAEQLLRHSLAGARDVSPPNAVLLGRVLNRLGVVLTDGGRLPEAAEALDEAQKCLRGALGEEHIWLGEVLHNTARIAWQRGDHVEAESLVRRAMAMQAKFYGSNHPGVIDSKDALAALLIEQGKLDDAEALLQEVLPPQRELYGDDDSRVANTLSSLGVIRLNQRDYAQAEALFREALQIHRAAMGDDHPGLMMRLNNLASVLFYTYRYDEAEPLFRDSLALCRKHLEPDHPDYLGNLINLANLYCEMQHLADAEPLAREAMEHFERIFPPDHAEIARSAHILATILRAKGDLAAAEHLARRAVEIRRQRFGADSLDLASSLANLGAILIDLARGEEAERVLRESLRIREQQAAEAWRCDTNRSLLGRALALQGRFAEAEPLLLKGYEGLAAGTGVPPNRAAEATERIALSYEAWHVAAPDAGKDREAQRWRERLEH